MKKITTAFSILLLFLSAFLFRPLTAHAADHGLTDGASLDISSCAEGDTVSVADGASVIITGSRNNIQINCGTGANVTLSGVTIDDSSFPGVCPLKFTGAGNRLTLAGDSAFKGGNDCPGVEVPEGAELRITAASTGSITAVGGVKAAGIGGVNGGNCGTVRIQGGTINATGGGNLSSFQYGGAGIGDGYEAGGGPVIEITGGIVNAWGGPFSAGLGASEQSAGNSITISGGTVNATGGTSSAAIGAGFDSTVGTIEITGGTVTATGGDGDIYGDPGGAGIGGGAWGNSGNITISGGTVTATGGNFPGSDPRGGAGIGGGCCGSGETIKISGGTVVATGVQGAAGIGGGMSYGPSYGGDGGTIEITGGTVFAEGAQDIGHGTKGTTASLTISETVPGATAVFLKNNNHAEPVSSSLTHLEGFAVEGNKALGIRVPEGTTWAGAYIHPVTAEYDANDGSGAEKTQVQQLGTKGAPLNANAFARDHYYMKNWNTAAKGDGASYEFGAEFNFLSDMTLYAQWAPSDYSIDYVLNGGTAAGNPASYNIETALFTLNNPTRAGYEFTGWTWAGHAVPELTVTIAKGSFGNRTYTANWEQNVFTINFDAQGGSAVSSVQKNKGESIAAAPVTARGDYSFSGWYTDKGVQVLFPYKATCDITLYAHWRKSVFTVSFDARGGSPVPDMQVNEGAPVAAGPAASKYGCNFTGWYTDPQCAARASFPYTVTSDITLYAGWSEQPQSFCLKDVGLSSGALNRAFNPKVTSYRINIGENETSFTLTPVKEWDGASMTINKQAASSLTLPVAGGKSLKLTVRVTLGKKSRTYTFTVTRAKSTNNALGSLSADYGAFDSPFDPNDTEYTLTLPEGVKSTVIRCSAATALARTSFKSKKVSLSNDERSKVKLVVTAQSGAKRTYIINVHRMPSTDTSVKYLKTNSRSTPLAPAYSAGITDYTVTLPADKESVTLSAGAAGYKAAVYFNGVKRPSLKVTLSAGESVVVRVEVRAQSGARSVYNITVRREISRDASLKSLTASPGSCVLSPVFGPDTANYSVTMPESSNSVTLYCKAAGYKAGITVNGSKKPYYKVWLDHGGSAQIIIRVTSQAGNWREYVVTVSRP